MTDMAVGTVTQALLKLARDNVDDRDLAGRICRACLDGLDVDGAAMSLLTSSVSRKPCGPPTRPPSCWRICSSP
jgi:hypothetical protein